MVPMKPRFVTACSVDFGVQELMIRSGIDLLSLTISILSLLHRAQVDFPKVLTTEIGLPCQRMLHLIRLCCIPGDGNVAPLGQIPAKCLA